MVCAQMYYPRELLSCFVVAEYHETKVCLSKTQPHPFIHHTLKSEPPFLYPKSPLQGLYPSRSTAHGHLQEVVLVQSLLWCVLYSYCNIKSTREVSEHVRACVCVCLLFEGCTACVQRTLVL